jgi:hypothetical protein
MVRDLTFTLGREHWEFVEKDEKVEKGEQDHNGWNAPRVCDTSPERMAEIDAVLRENKHTLKLRGTRPKL